MLSKEEFHDIKEKLISHIKKTFPKEKIDSAIEYLEEMNSEELENFLEENKIFTKDKEEDCVFCLIAEGKINSINIGENKNAVAVLEINPVSKGHTIIIPKKHEEKVDKEIYSFAEEIAEKLKKKLKPKKVDLSNSKLFGHGVINLIPVYENENANSEKKHAELKELEKIKEEIEKEDVIPVPVPVEKKEEFLWLPKRIP